MDPTELPAAGPNDLTPEQYHLIVSPALQVAAELAAVRGDPELYNDMASMLTLRALIRRFGALYAAAEPAAATAAQAAIEAAPDATCTMVLQRGELEQQELDECIWALGAAEKQLAEGAVYGAEGESAEAAWAELRGGNREHAVARLKFAAGILATNIDKWERARDAAREAAQS